MKQLFFCTGKRTVAPTFTATPTLSAVAFVVGNTVTCNASYTGVVSGVVYSFYRGVTLLQTGASPNYDLLQVDASNTAGFYCKVGLVWSGGIVEANTAVQDVVFDEDAYNYTQAVPITDITQQLAANFEMYTMKAGGVVSGYVGGYPVMGGTAASHKWNMFNPVDSDAAKRLVYSGTVTHGPNGMQGNAVNGKANTFINPSIDLNGDFAIWFYSRTTSTTAAWADLGVIAGGANPGIAMSVKTNAANAFSANCDINTALAAIANSGGFFLMKRVGNTVTIKRNDVTIHTFTAPNTSYQNGVINLMCLSVLPASFVNYSGKQYTDFGAVKATFTASMDTAVYNAVLGKETILGRNV